MDKKMNDKDIIKATDILAKFDFFYGQRAGRELWNEKPVDVQDKDIETFSNDVVFLKDFIKRQQAEIERLEDVLLGVMLSVDKWLEGDELKKNEVQRAAIMREKTLRIEEKLLAEIEKLTIQKNAFGAGMKVEAKKHQEVRAEAIKEFCEKRGIEYVETDI